MEQLHNQKVRNKPSYFKTLPDNIALSPTGVPRLPNSPFPSIDPSRNYKSVYERAGFDVYKPPSHIQKSTIKSRSTSNVEQSSNTSKFNDQKRVASEHVPYTQSLNNSSRLISKFNAPSTKKSPLRIDPFLANKGYTGSVDELMNTQASTPSSEHSMTQYQPSSTTSSRFNTKVNSSAEDVSGSALTSTSGSVPGSAYASARSLPYSSPSSKDKPLQSDINQFQGLSGHRQQSYTSPPTHQITNVQQPSPTSQESISQEQSTQQLYEETSPVNQRFKTRYPSQSPTNNSARSPIDSTFDRINGASHESSVMGSEGSITNGSSYSVNSVPKARSSPLSAPPVIKNDSLSAMTTPENDHDSSSDDESLKSGILSPQTNFDFENQPSTIYPDSPSTTFNESQFLHPSQHQQTIPQFTFSGPDSETTSPQKISSRYSKVASSIYPDEHFRRRTAAPLSSTTEEYRAYVQQQKQVSSAKGNELLKELHEMESDDEIDTSAQAFEDLEEELEKLVPTVPRVANESLNLDDSEYSRPLDIQVHTLKQVSTERDVSHKTNMTPTIESRFNPSTPNVVVSEFQGDHDNDKTTDDQDNIPIKEVLKYAPGEGPCRKCNLEITHKPIYSKSGELSGQWHRSCFTCTLCDVKFNKNINCFVLDDLPYCEHHYHLTNNSYCTVCGKGIVGQCLENDAQERYHIDCLKCTKCQKLVDSDYLSVNGAVFCEPCAMEFTSGNETEKVEKRRTRLNFI